MSITALDKSTVKFLKSSQVITSVSYAVKELVENSLDAGAKNIEVNLYDDGLTQIEVKDDGSGISKENAPFMALASYTSKINNFNDLEKLHTYGFRGEALQALCQIAEVTITTKTENEEISTMYTHNSNGNIIKSEPCHRPVGTTVQVNGLFKKMPVRRQTLLNSKRANQDLKYLEVLLKNFGIIQPFLRITYRRNKQIIFIKSSANSLIESITNVWGKDMSSKLEWIEEQVPEGKVQLMLPRKDLQDPTVINQSGPQCIFVNSRILTHKELEKLLNKRIHEYYSNKGTTLSKKCLFFLNIIVESSNLDINLEPNKTKGFLKNEKEMIESIDKILMTFYQLGESQEEKNDNQDEIFALNDTNDSVWNDINKETEWPACKKRKIELNGKESIEHIVEISETAKSLEHSDHEHSPEQETLKIQMMKNVIEPILSESDSNSGDGINFSRKRRNVASNKLIVNKPMGDSNMFDSEMNFSNQIRIFKQSPKSKTPMSDIETLSQLPVVDLGEDFESQVIREKRNQMLKSNDSSSMNEDESLFSDLDLGDEFSFNKNSEESKNTLKQSTLSFSTSEKGDIFLEVDKCDVSKQVANPDSWSRGQVPGLKAGYDAKVFGSESGAGEQQINPNSLTGFNMFLSQTRPQLMKENPEMSVPQIANLLTNRWREMTSEEKGHYRKVANDKIKQEEILSKKAKKEKQDLEKNKKRVLDILKSMKNKKNDKNKFNETLKSRTTATMETNIAKITEKFNRPEKLKKTIVIGSLKPSLWIVKVASQFVLVDVAEMYKKLNFTEHSSNETNTETLETLLKRWTTEKDDMSVMYVIDSKI